MGKEKGGGGVKGAWELAKELNDEVQLKEAFQQDRIALSVVGALVMSMAISAILTEREALEAAGKPGSEYVIGVFVVAGAVSLSTSMLGMWIGSYQYLLINKTPPSLVWSTMAALRRKEGRKRTSSGTLDPGIRSSHLAIALNNPIVWVQVSLWALLVCALACVYLMHDNAIFFAVLAVFLANLLIMLYVAWNDRKQATDVLQFAVKANVINALKAAPALGGRRPQSLVSMSDSVAKPDNQSGLWGRARDEARRKRVRGQASSFTSSVL